MILLSKMADYGVIVMVRLASSPDRQINAVTLADDTHLSEATVAKVLKSLTRSGLVASTRGPTGGYHLARTASAITVAEIVAAIDGPFGVTECTSNEDACDRVAFCTTKPAWNRINTAINAALSSVSLAEMTPARDRFMAAPLPHETSTLESFSV